VAPHSLVGFFELESHGLVGRHEVFTVLAVCPVQEEKGVCVGFDEKIVDTFAHQVDNDWMVHSCARAHTHTVAQAHTHTRSVTGTQACDDVHG
jgi:hypothetical protein